MARNETAAGNPYVVDFHQSEKRPTIGRVSTGEGVSFNGDRIPPWQRTTAMPPISSGAESSWSYPTN